MIVDGIVIRNLTLDFPEYHKKTWFSVEFPLRKYATCLLGEGQNRDDSIFVHQI